MKVTILLPQTGNWTKKRKSTAGIGSSEELRVETKIFIFILKLILQGQKKLEVLPFRKYCLKAGLKVINL